MVWVVARGMEDGDADKARWVDCSHDVFSFRKNTAQMMLGVYLPFGCHTSPKNFIVGGLSG